MRCTSDHLEGFPVLSYHSSVLGAGEWLESEIRHNNIKLSGHRELTLIWFHLVPVKEKKTNKNALLKKKTQFKDFVMSVTPCYREALKKSVF